MISPLAARHAIETAKNLPEIPPPKTRNPVGRPGRNVPCPRCNKRYDVRYRSGERKLYCLKCRVYFVRVDTT